jgi:hypothetical protein
MRKALQAEPLSKAAFVLETNSKNVTFLSKKCASAFTRMFMVLSFFSTTFIHLKYISFE